MENEELRHGLEDLLRQMGGTTPKFRVAEVKDRLLKEKGRLSPKTLHQYEWSFRKLAEYSEYWPSDASVINGFIGSLKGLNDESVLEIFKCLRAVGRYTNKTYGWADPTEKAERPAVKHKRRRYLTADELRAVIGACREVRDKALILCLLDSSARVGDLASLKVSGLGEDYFTAVGKTGKRRYRCDPRVVALLRECAVGDVIFPMMDAGRRVIEPVRPCKSNVLGDRVRVIMERAGLTGEKLGPHTLRHTAASLVARGTKSALAVKALLQHDNIATSMLYIHDAEDAIQQEVSPMQLAGVKVGGVDGKQLGIEDADRLALPSPGGSIGPVSDLIGDLFPEVPDGAEVRPRLNSADLRLIKDGLMELMRVRDESGSGSRCVQLMRRMLRRV